MVWFLANLILFLLASFSCRFSLCFYINKTSALFWNSANHSILSNDCLKFKLFCTLVTQSDSEFSICVHARSGSVQKNSMCLLLTHGWYTPVQHLHISLSSESHTKISASTIHLILIQHYLEARARQAAPPPGHPVSLCVIWEQNTKTCYSGQCIDWSVFLL